jgi:hypothetical protein
MIEYYRQFAFVSSALAGFAFAFYGTLLPSGIASEQGPLSILFLGGIRSRTS